MNLMMLLDMACSGHPDRVAVSDEDGTSLTYQQLYDRVGVAADRLREGGYRHLAYVGSNSSVFAVAVFATAWAGIPILPLNYRLGREQIESILDAHPNSMVIADDGAQRLLADSRHQLRDRSEWMSTTATGTMPEPWTENPDDIAVLLYTSGTTSAPKAAILRHRHLMSYVLSAVDFASADDTEAAVVTVPPYHVAGLANLLSNLYAGRRLVYLQAFDPRHWLATVREQQVTHAMVVPTMLARLVSALEGQETAAVPTLRSVSYGGSRVAPSVVADALRLFPTTDFVNAYGLTETSSTIAVLGPVEHRAALTSADPLVRARLGSAGRLIPGLQAEIRDAKDRPLPAGVPGELWLRGEQISGEYLTGGSALDDDGWFPTRDRAYFDDDGFLFIEGRIDDTIIRGGENIAPAEIEDVLVQHEAVAEAAVVGLPDLEWGQQIVAVVVLSPNRTASPLELREFVRSHMRSSKTPQRIEIWNALPYTDTGKLLRRAVLATLRDQPALVTAPSGAASVESPGGR